MNASSFLRRTVASVVLLAVAVGAAVSIAAVKHRQQAAAAAAAGMQQEPAEVSQAALVHTHPYARATTAIGTVRALQSITLRNELPGTVRKVALTTGQVVEPGTVLVELDVTVEEAELHALEAEARLAESMLSRMEQAQKNQGASAADVDRARAQHDMAAANVKRVEALIDRKRIRAPFRARVGMVDLHPGQYLDPGAMITTLQGVDEAVHIDFAVTQDAAAALHLGDEVEIRANGSDEPTKAKIVAIDARVDANTRNTTIRALLQGVPLLPAPGSSVRVKAPVEAPHDVLVVPVSALRRGPGGAEVFVLVEDKGQTRAHSRRVQSGTVLGDDVVIHDGLKVGERVATDGSFKLRENVLVIVPPVQTPAGGDGATTQQPK